MAGGKDTGRAPGPPLRMLLTTWYFCQGLYPLVRFSFLLLHILTMSLQHVLEVARKNGMPVIITDMSGREPMVIMPLEQFEAMAFSTQSSMLNTQFSVSSTQSQKDTAPGIRNSELDNAIAEMAAERAKSRMEEAARQLEDLTKQTQSPLDEEIPLEERFYIEPNVDR